MTAVPAAAIGLAVVLLGWRAVEVLSSAIGLVSFPLSLDYGEGIVLQQAQMMTGPRAYGSITEAPFIVFHYPPVYHLAVRAVVAVSGGADPVEAARLVSLLAALVVAAALASLAISAAPAGRWSWLAGASAALAFLGTVSVELWLPLARVDMLSLAFTMGGLAVAARAASSRSMILGAVLLFVLGVFTKQTSLAAPAAAVAVLLASDRRRGIEAILVGLAVSLLLLGVAQRLTDGGFLRHVVAYNVNRFEFLRLLLLIQPVAMQLPTLAAIAFGLMAGGATGDRGIFAGLREDRRRRARAMLVVHFTLTSAMLVLMGKSGSSVNYLLEWACSGAALAGVAVGRAVDALRNGGTGFRAGRLGIVTMAAALAIQPFLLPPAGARTQPMVAQVPHVAPTLIAAIRESGRSVISDDMVAVLRAGQPVLWEPAIFAELASLGRWDEAAIVSAIRDGAFAFAVTVGARGSGLFDSRYNPAVADAMDRAWPQKARLGWLTLHLPAESALPPGAIPLPAPR